MSNCPRTETCSFYAQTTPLNAQELRERYCMGNPLACARYAVDKAMGSDSVPPTLSPHQHAEARRLLASGPQ